MSIALRRVAGAAAPAGRRAALVAGAPARAVWRVWSGLRPAQRFVAGFLVYSVVGTLLLCLPAAQERSSGVVDNLFNAVSAVSTTGLTTVSVSDHYSAFGECVVLVLFQVGGVGFMTLSSVIVLARGRTLSASRVDALRAGFSLPAYFRMHHFLVHVVVFTAVCEGVGALVLWWRFAAVGVDDALWSAVFHAVSAFATAGFSLNNDSLESFRGDWVVCVTVGVLSYLGAIGFIVAQDVWYSLKLRERMLTFTSRVILWMTGVVFVVGTVLLAAFEPSLSGLPAGERLLAGAFQTMTASTTAGFNTVPIGGVSSAGLVLLMVAMLVGASPSGTGGGIKTTSVSAVLANLVGVLRGRDGAEWLGHEVPAERVRHAFAACSLYLIGLCAGVLALCVTESLPFVAIVFESASAIGTVGLSMGVTGELSVAGKLAVVALMFFGRCGPLTVGLAMLRPGAPRRGLRRDDLAV